MFTEIHRKNDPVCICERWSEGCLVSLKQPVESHFPEHDVQYLPVLPETRIRKALEQLCNLRSKTEVTFC